MFTSHKTWLSLLCAAGVWWVSANTQAQFQDLRVQPPTIKAPQRGSVAGQLSSVSFGATEVSRGSFSLPIAMELPQEDGAAGASPFPTYSSEAGLSEWGLGFQNTALSIERFRQVGALDFKTDGLRGPWGAMTLGSDGAYYPLGLRSTVRVVVKDATLVAHLADGSRHTFGSTPESRIDTIRGTFAWHLTSVESPTGRLTKLRYEQQRTGMPYLVEQTYGGTDPTQPRVRVSFELESTRLTRDYRSGELRYRHRRVKRVRVASRDGSEFKERYRYELAYDAPPASPGFHIISVQRVFASGELGPLAKYDYGNFEQTLASARAVRNDVLYPLVAGMGLDLVWPTRSTLADVNDDGRLDLEVSADGALYLQSDQGFVRQPARTPARVIETRCRLGVGAGSTPRNLTQMLPGRAEAQAVFFDYRIAEDTTDIGVCELDGTLISMASVRGAYRPGASVVYVDLDRDLLPELVRVDAASITVLRNVSTRDTVRFQQELPIARAPALTVEGLWVFDVNGDGLSDIITRNGPALRVHHGLANGAVSPSGQLYQFVSRDGTAISEGADVRFHFLDVNKDGLADVVRQAPAFSLLYVNQGDGLFRGTPAAAIEAIGGWQSNFAAPVDLTGSGESEVYFVSANRPMSIALTAPATGLLVSADDGQGTILRFAYQRAPTKPGLSSREAVLQSVTLQSAGQGTVQHRYTYGAPVAHSRSHTLVGFGQVDRDNAGERQLAQFYNDDDHAGLATASRVQDVRTPGMEKFEDKSYEIASGLGLTWKRLRTEAAGYRFREGASTKEVSDLKEYRSYVDHVCPSLVRLQTEHGTLETTTTYRAPSAFLGHLSCFSTRVSMVGKHPLDAALDSTNTAQLSRNSLGQVTEVAMEGPGGKLVDQTVRYDAQGRITSLAQNSTGTTTLRYDSDSELVDAITAPDGVVTSIDARDPITRALLQMSVDRGASTRYSQFFRYDGQERLQKSWNPITGASESAPNATYNYRYASESRSGAVFVRTLSRLSQSLGIYQDVVELRSAADEAIASATRIPGGYQVGEVVVRDRATRSESKRRADAVVADVASLGLSSLLGLGHFVSDSQASAIGFEAASREVFHQDVLRVLATKARVDDALQVEETENGAHTTSSGFDAGRRPTSRVDEDGNTWRYRYDVLGRLRRIELPDGVRHESTFDPYGRLARVVREGVAAVSYHYDPTTGQLSERCFASVDAPDDCLREVLYQRDAIGRAIVETHVDVQSGEERSFEFLFDGVEPHGGTSGSARGSLTGVRGHGFERTLRYRADGVAQWERLTITGFAEIDRTVSYDPDGAIAQKKTVVVLPNGRVVSDVTEGTQRDEYGRVSGLAINGEALFALRYDARGLLAGGDFKGSLAPAGGSVDFDIDAVSQRVIGLKQRTTSLKAAFSQRRSARGLVEAEHFEVGADHRDRTYEHDARRYLVSAVDAKSDYSYDYDESGNIVASENPAVDALGRVISHADAQLKYGPDGQIQSALLESGDTIGYLYDEQGQRIARIENGIVQAMFPHDGEYFDPQLGLIAPMRTGPTVVGALAHGGLATTSPRRFHMVAVDLRGTVQSDRDGTSRIPSPYGVFAQAPDLARAIGYVTKGYDPDLGTVRMGLRDYAPEQGKFLTPDPKLLESLEEAQKSPVEASLYGYAKNDPLSFVDPTGTTTLTADDALRVLGLAGSGAITKGARAVAGWLVGGLTAGGAIAGGVVVGIGLIAMTGPPKATSVTLRMSATVAVEVPCNDVNAQQFRHHTIPKALLAAMSMSGLITPMVAEHLRSFAGIGLISVDRGTHLALHKALSAYLAVRHPGLLMTNGYQTAEDWQNYITRLGVENNFDPAKMKFQLLQDLGVVYAGYDIFVIGKGQVCDGASESAVLKFGEAAAAVMADPAVQMWHPPMP